MKKLTTWEILHSLDIAIACAISYTITTELLVRLVDEPTKLLGALFAVIATVFVFRESRQQPVRGTGSPHRDVRQLRCMPSLSFDFSRHGFGHGGRYRFGRDRDDTFEPRGPHCHYGDHDRSCLSRRTIEPARSVAATISVSCRYAHRHRCRRLLQMVRFVRLLSDRRGARTIMGPSYDDELHAHRFEADHRSPQGETGVGGVLKGEGICRRPR